MFIEREMLKKDEVLITNKKSVDLYDLLVSRSGENLFKK